MLSAFRKRGSRYEYSVALRCLITAGPTREFLDPVRFLSNPSTGKMGFALAAAARERGWTVDLVAGPVNLPEPEGVVLYPVVSAEQMLHQVDGLFGACDIFIATAAVSDWRPLAPQAQKIKREAGVPKLELEACPDILKIMSSRRTSQQLLVGFAAETTDIEKHAQHKLVAKGLDFIAANTVSGPGSAFGADTNRLVVLGRDGSRVVLGPAAKSVVARDLIAHLAAHLVAR